MYFISFLYAERYMEHRHFKIYKPSPCLSQFRHAHIKRKNKIMLGSLYDFPDGMMSIGRLDEHSEGLLLLTTDGKLSYRILSRKYEKEYYVQLDGVITDEAINKIQAGVQISVKSKPYLTLPCAARKIDAPNFPPGHRIRDERHGPTSWASITIREGKNRQVRRMTAAVGFPTLRLVRVRIGEVRLDDLQPGEVVEIPMLDELF